MSLGFKRLKITTDNRALNLNFLHHFVMINNDNSRRPGVPSNHVYNIKVKRSRNRPGVAQRVPGGLGSQISMKFDTRRW